MKKIFILVLLLITIVSLCSCEDIQKQIKEESVEKIVGKIMGEEVDVTIISPTPDADASAEPDTTSGIFNDIIKSDTDGDIEWPEDIPSLVPELSAAIKSRMKTPNGVILDYGEMDNQTAIQYSETLKSNSFDTIREDISEKKYDALYRKDEVSVTVYWYEGGSLSVMITW